ncbi:MAG: hypothetical protein KBT27_05480 [Prevotellaceae bacterium]|nr:hypothetical protein [Candidatus Faecinaster equi]
MNDDRLYPTLIKCCPCCGGDAEGMISKDLHGWVGIKCQKCGLRTGYYTNIIDAAKDWNKRIEED